MPTSIAKTALVLTTDSSQMEAGLVGAGARIRSWAATAGNAIKGSALGSLGKGLGSTLSTALMPMKSIALAGLGVGSDFLTEGISKIKELAKVGQQARSIGLLSEDLMSLSMQGQKFGIDSETMTKALVKFNAATADSSVLGLDLDNKSLMEKFEAVADKIKSIEDPAHQAQAAVQAFGKQGPAMLPLLQQGAAGIEAFKKKQMELGNAVGQGDMSRVMLAAKAIPRIGEMFDGFKTKITVALAPLIETFGQLFDYIMPVAQKVLSFAADAYSSYLSGMSTLWQMVIEWTGELIKEVVDLVSSWNLFGDSIPSMGDIFDKTFRVVGKIVAWVFDTIKAGIGFLIIGIGALVSSVGKAGKMIGADWGAKWEEAGGKMMNVGKNWADQFGDSAGKVDEFFDRVAARRKAMDDEAIKTAGQVRTEYSAIGALVQGSKEAVSLEAKWKTQSLTGNPMFAVQRDQLAEQRKGNGLLQRLIDAGRDVAKVEVI